MFVRCYPLSLVRSTHHFALQAIDALVLEGGFYGDLLLPTRRPSDRAPILNATSTLDELVYFCTSWVR